MNLKDGTYLNFIGERGSEEGIRRFCSKISPFKKSVEDVVEPGCNPANHSGYKRYRGIPHM